MMEKLKIQVATLEDMKEISTIEKEIFRDAWSYDSLVSSLDNENIIYFITKKDNRIISYVAIWVLFDECHIINVAVIEAYRRLGIGMAMVRHIIDKGRSLGFDYFTLEVRKSNISAQKMYEKIGFQVDGIRPRYYIDNKEDAVIMSLTV